MAHIGPFSYRLKIAVEPQWAEIIKQVVGLYNDQEQKEFAERLKDHLRDDRMLHRHYDFTEFFDSQTGLTAKFQRVHANGKTHSGFVQEFADAGYLFGRDNPLVPEDQQGKHQIAITEHGVRTECFDPHSGQFDSFFGPSLFEFPIDALVEFGVALQLRFPEITTSHVTKWPDNIEAALQRNGTKYEDMWSYKPKEFNIEKEDREFFSRYGKPKVATTASWPTPYFMHPCCYYCIELEVFTPESAQRSARLANPHFGSDGLLD